MEIKELDQNTGSSDEPAAAVEGKQQQAQDGQGNQKLPDKAPFPIVGIGASTDGLPALIEFVKGAPVDPGLAFVVVQRLSTQPQNNLASLLQAQTLIPVLAIEDQTEVQPNHIYVFQPGKNLAIKKGVLSLSEPEHYYRAPIDFFFRSLAEDQGENAVAIVLAGTGTDGALGLKMVKERDGVTMAQSLEEAEPDEMPQNAIRTGLIDIVGPSSELAKKLVEYKKNMARIQLPERAKGLSRDDSQALSRIFAQLRDKTGHDFTYYKRSTILRRIERRMQVNRIESIAEYLGYLRQNPEETYALFKDFLISVTNFFRDPEAFAALEKQVIPKLFENKKKNHQVRVWAPGCATGEEAYSVAILLYEYTAELNKAPELQVFATDIDEEAIAFAREGLYSETIAGDMSPKRLQRFFYHESEGYRIKREIREMVLFAKHNLLKDPAFSRLDLISCRNLLIYLNREVQNKVFELFHYALNSGGYLFLGSAEAASVDSHLFSTQDKKYRLFQRRDTPTTTPRFITMPLIGSDEEAGQFEQKLEKKARSIEETYQVWTLKRHAPPRLVVNENYDITHIFSGVSKYLQEHEGPITQNVLERVLPGFRVDLRTVLHQAFQKKERTTSRWLRLEVEGEPCVIRLQVGPIDEPNFPPGYVEVVFEENPEGILKQVDAKVQVEKAENILVSRLEEELQRTKERLQTTIEEQETTNEELRASNEELQSMNEELRSTTEELETSKEELQSMNEELITVNQELKTKIDELSETNSDLQNLISSTDIGTIFLDRALRIKRYSPRVTDLFNIIPSDVGRPYDHISHQLNDDHLLKDARRVLDKLVMIERELQSQTGHWYIMRMLPYRTIEDRIDGVVITFVEVTPIKQAEQELTRRARQQAAVANLGQLALAGMELNDFMREVAQQVAEKLEVEYCKILELLPDKKHLLLKAGFGWKEGYVGHVTVGAEQDSQAGYALRAEGPVIVEDLAKETRFHGPSLLLEHEVVSGMSVIIYGLRQPYGVLGAHTTQKRHFNSDDISFLQSVANLLAEAIERKQTEDQLRQSQAQIGRQLAELQAVYTSAPVGLAVLDTGLRYVRINDYLARINGRPVDEHIGRAIYEVIPDLADQIEPLFRQVIDSGEPVTSLELRATRPGYPKEERVWLESCYPLQTAEGQIVGINVVVQDITEHKRAEIALQESETRFRHLADAMPQIVWTNDPQGKVEYLNQRWLDYTGFTFEESQAFGIYQVVHPDDLKRAREVWAETARQGQPYTDELRFRGADSIYRWHLVRSVPIRDAEGNVEHWFGTSTDIDERKRAEQRLAAEHAITHVLTGAESLETATPQLLELFCQKLNLDVCEIWLPDQADGRLVRGGFYARDTFEKLDEFNATTEQIVFRPGVGIPGRVWQSKQPVWVTEVDEEPQPIHSTLATEFGLHSAFGFPILDDGECIGVFTFFSRQALAPDGPLLEMMAAIGRDIEQFIQRTEAEQALRKSEERYRRVAHRLSAVVNTAVDGIITIDEDGIIESVNPAAEEIFGYTGEELVGQNVKILMPPPYHEEHDSYLSNYLRTGERKIIGLGREVQGRHKDGRVFPLDLAVSETYISGYRVFTGIVRDITERKQAEEQLRQHTHILETLLEINTSLAAELDLEKVVQAVTDAATELSGAQFGAFFYNIEVQQDEAYMLYTLSGALREAFEQFPMPRNTEIFGPTFRGEGIVRLDDVTQDSRYGKNLPYQGMPEGHLPVRSYLAVPVISRTGQVIGGLFFGHAEPGVFTERAEQLVVGVAAQAAVAIDNARLYTDLRESEERFRVALKNAPILVYNTDRELRYTWVASPIYNFTGEQVIGRRDDELLPPDSVAELIQLKQGVLDNGVGVRREIALKVANQLFYYDITIEPLRDEAGEIDGLIVAALDITNRKQAEEALRQSEERYRMAARATNDAIWDHDLRTDQVTWNQAVVDLFGYPEALNGADADWWRERLHPDDQEKVVESIKAAREGNEERWVNEYRFLRADGSYADVLDRGFVLRDEHGAPIRMIGAMLDLTEHKQTEQALRESEQRFRGTFENAAVGMAHVGIDGQWLRVNQRLCQIVGYDREEMLQKTFQEITHPDDLAADLEQLERLVRGDISSYQMEKRYIRKNGEPVWINLTVSLQHGATGEPLYCICAIEDISDRKHTDEQLRFLAQASTLLASSLDYQTTLQRVADLMVPNLADWCAVDILQPDGSIELVAVAHVDPEMAAWARELRKHRPPRIDDPGGLAQVIRTGQSEFYPEIPEELLAAAVKDEEGAAIIQKVGFKSVIIVPLPTRERILGGITLVWSDTDRRYNEIDLRFAEELARRAALAVENARLYREAREAEAELRSLNETLEQRVAERTAELERSNRELDQFAYVASHDLKAPLRAIDNLATWITEDASDILPESSKRHLRTMRGRVKRMEELLNDLLTYSRADRLDTKIVEVDTRVLVTDVIELLAPPPNFTVTVQPNLPTIMTAQTPLEIVFRNLIDNAIKHHHRTDGRVEIAAREQKDYIEFSVADDGPGIDPLFHERIFQMFQTLQPRDRVEGSGMGLAVVKKVVETQGGAISVASTEGHGSTFSFTWPREPKK